MGKDEKAMWDWLCDDMDTWSEYAKKEEEKNENSAKDDNRHNSKFNAVNDRIRIFLNRVNCDPD